MQSISWYANRLKLMSAKEVAWRFMQSARNVADGWQSREASPPIRAAGGMKSWPPPAQIDPQGYIDRAEEICAGTVRLFGLPVEVGGETTNWNQDPFSRVVAPQRTGTAIDYRDARLVGNARNIWELNRHFQLVELGQAWALTKNARYRDTATSLLGSWLRACPYPLGINWVSALEHGIRLLNWHFAARLMGLSAGDSRGAVAGWQESIYWHCRFIWRHQSRFSSANNHLIGEMAGLYVAAVTWPCWNESQHWRAGARRILLQEMDKQINADGVSREQTTGYQMFVLQLALTAGLVGEQSGDPFPVEYWTAVQRMISFLRSITDAGGHLPAFGDSDDGLAYVLSPTARSRRLEDLLELEEVYSATAPSRPSDHSAAAWFQSGFPRPAHWPAGSLLPRASFPDGGYFVLAGNRGQPREVQVVFDAAPLGYLSIAAHGHADCLSFVMSVAGEEILVDPGTYCYHSDPAWRDYFRSTRAHNTVGIDGLDQSVMAGPFMWLDRARPTVHQHTTGATKSSLSASHDGYRRLPDPVTHQRTVQLDAGAAQLVVVDILDCAGSHTVERSWNVAPECRVSRAEDGSVTIAGRRARVTLTCSDGDSIELFTGSESPRRGWVSRTFGVKEPACCIVVTNRVKGGCELTTVFDWTVGERNSPDSDAR